MHRLFLLRVKQQWFLLLILALCLISISFIMHLSWRILGGSSGQLMSLLRDGIEMLHVFGGAGISGTNLAPSFLALGWRHPIVIALLLGYVLSRGSKAVAAEVEEDTAGFLFSLPYPRPVIILVDYLSTMVGLGLLVGVLIFGGLFFGRAFGPDLSVSIYMVTAWATFWLYMAFGSLAYFLSSLLKKSSYALNISLLLVVLLYLIDLTGNVLGLFEGLQRFSLFGQYNIAYALSGASLSMETFSFIGAAVFFLGLSLVVTTIRDL